MTIVSSACGPSPSRTPSTFLTAVRSRIDVRLADDSPAGEFAALAGPGRHRSPVRARQGPCRCDAFTARSMRLAAAKEHGELAAFARRRRRRSNFMNGSPPSCNSLESRLMRSASSSSGLGMLDDLIERRMLDFLELVVGLGQLVDGRLPAVLRHRRRAFRASTSSLQKIIAAAPCS